MSVSTCEEISAELVAFLDGALAADDRRPVAAHVSTCSTCRREIERLTTVQRLVATLPASSRARASPSISGGALDAESRAGGDERPPPAPTAVRAVPALAGRRAPSSPSRLRSLTSTPPSPSRRGTPASAAAPVALQPRARRAPTPSRRAAEAEEEAAQLADVDALRPEDLPPDLLEHPELFLRLPVVRRLEKLEHLGSDQERQGTDDGAG